MSAELPYMPIFVNDVLARMADRDATERGASLSLMLGCWKAGGSLPLDHRRLARLAGVDASQWDSVWQVIASDFEVDGDQIRHPVVTAEMSRAREMQDARRRGAEVTNAQRRAQRNGQRDAERTDSAALSERTAGRSRVGIPSPDPSPSPDPNAKEEEDRRPLHVHDGQDEDPEAGAAIEAYRKVRDRAAKQRPEIDISERDLPELRQSIGKRSPEERKRIGRAAVLFFKRTGRNRDDDHWQRRRWDAHTFATQGLDDLLPVVMADGDRYVGLDGWADEYDDVERMTRELARKADAL